MIDARVVMHRIAKYDSLFSARSLKCFMKHECITEEYDTLSQDPLLAIFGSGRLTDSVGSQCSQDDELTFSCLDTYREPESDDTSIKKLFVSQSDTKKQTDHSKPGNNQTVSPDLVSHPSKDDTDIEGNHGSLDLFSSQPTHGSLIEENIDITLQLTEFVWVQCDSPDCQKWRRIPASDAEDLGDNPWYCYMSTDPNRNTCSAEEEDHLMYDRMAKKAGIKFVMSMLSVGSLVWAKMAGYCRWPALITRDPEIGCHVLIDMDGDPYSYHVEFLGKSHSHSWIAAKFIEVYGHKAQPGLDDSLSQSKIQTKKKQGKVCGRGRQKKIKLSNVGAGKKKKSYKRMHIDGVIQEADFLLGLEQEERLNYSVFKYDPCKQIKSEKMKKASSQTSCEKCSQCKKKGRKKKDVLAGEERKNIPCKNILGNLGERNNLQQVRQGSGGGQKKIKTGKENFAVFDYTSDGATQSNCDVSLDEGISVKTEMSVFDSPDQFSQSQLKFMNSMMDKSKEEKFSIDIDMYRKNEAAFEHDVRRFMRRNGQNIRNTPVWHTVPVRLFQLYLAVHERGGFQQVNKKKQWSAVYKELTEQQHVSCGVVAKKYYQNNLYPYELYITGRDYESILKERRKSEGKRLEKKACQTHGAVENMTSSTTEEVKGKSDALPEHLKDDGTTLSQDIEAILECLEDDSRTEKNTDPPTRKAGVKFHDDTTESSQVEHKVPSEFQPSSSAGDVQEVPRISYSGDGLSDIEEKILHEMKALEDDIKEISHLD